MTQGKICAFQTRFDRDGHQVFVVAPTRECYTFTIPEALDFAHGLLVSAALCAGEDEDAKQLFRASIQSLMEMLDMGAEDQ